MWARNQQEQPKPSERAHSYGSPATVPANRQSHRFVTNTTFVSLILSVPLITRVSDRNPPATPLPASSKPRCKLFYAARGVNSSSNTASRVSSGKLLLKRAVCRKLQLFKLKTTLAKENTRGKQHRSTRGQEDVLGLKVRAAWP